MMSQSGLGHKKLVKNRAKMLPYSDEAERYLIGALLLNANAWDQVSDRVHDSDNANYCPSSGAWEDRRVI